MPDIELSACPDDLGWVVAIMLFPNNKDLRRQYFAVHRTRGEILNAKDTNIVEVDGQSLRLLIDAPSYEQLRTLTAENTKRGIVAGDILGALYLMARFSMPEPSLNKAIYLAEEFARSESGVYGDGACMNVSDRAIRNYWEEFKPVAHLWAAFRLNQAYPFCPERELFTEQYFIPFLEVAAGILAFGCSFVPYRARPRAPILDQAKTWNLPKEVKQSQLVSDRLPQRMLSALKNYKAPKSIV